MGVEDTEGRGLGPRVGACDEADTCDGQDPECPADGVKAAGTVCRPVARC